MGSGGILDKLGMSSRWDENTREAALVSSSVSEVRSSS